MRSKENSKDQKTESFVAEQGEPEILDEGSPVKGQGKITEAEREQIQVEIERRDPETFASTYQSQMEEEGPQVTTAGTQHTFENIQEDDPPVLFNKQVRFAFEEDVRSSVSEFGDSPCLAFCCSCKQRALTIVQDNKSWLSSCFLWLRCLAAQEAQHVCGNCGQVLSRVEAN